MKKSITTTQAALAIESPVPLTSVEEEKPARPAKTSQRHVKQISEWIEDRGEDTEPSGTETETDIDVDTQALDDFLDSSDTGYLLRVYRLPEYAKNGRTSIRNIVREFCTEMPFAPDYMTIIKDTYGPGTYQLELRNEMMQVIKRKAVHIAAPRFPSLPPTHNPSRANDSLYLLNPADPIDPFKSVAQTLKIFREMRDTFGLDQPAQPVQNQAASPDTVEGAVVRLAMAEEGERSRIIRNILRPNGGSDHEIGWLDILFKLVENLPESIRMIQQMIQQGNGQPATRPPQMSTPQGNPPNQPEVENSSGSQAINQMVQSPENQLLNFMIGACANNWPADQAANEIENFLFANPQLKPLVDNLSRMPAQDILVLLSQTMPVTPEFINHPQTRLWIEALQQELSEPETEEPDDAA